MSDINYFEFQFEDKSTLDLIEKIRDEKLKAMTESERERYIINEKKIQQEFDKNLFNFVFP